MPDAPTHPAIQRVLDAAARKGVTLEVIQFDESTHTAAEAAAALDVELGQIVKSLVFVIPAAAGGEPVLCAGNPACPCVVIEGCFDNPACQ